jgi:hypothetical protein
MNSEHAADLCLCRAMRGNSITFMSSCLTYMKKSCPFSKSPGFSRELDITRMLLKRTKELFNYISSRTFMFWKSDEYFLLSLHHLVMKLKKTHWVHTSKSIKKIYQVRVRGSLGFPVCRKNQQIYQYQLWMGESIGFLQTIVFRHYVCI